MNKYDMCGIWKNPDELKSYNLTLSKSILEKEVHFIDNPCLEKQILKSHHKIDDVLNIKEFDEKEYFDKLNDLIEQYKVKEKDIKSKPHWDEIQKKLETELTNSIWKLNNSINLPSEYKYLVKETRNIINKIKNSNWNFNVWLNSYLVPWSVSSLRKLIDNKLIEAKNISMILWNWVNIQEWVRFIKHSENWNPWWVEHYETNKDNIEKINIKLWDNSSVAHSVVFQWIEKWDNKFEFTIETWENVFLWINAHIWSWVKIWDNTSIWWGSVINDNVSIWKNVVIWQWVKLEAWVIIPNDCLVPNWAIIKEWFEIVDYDYYITNENDCDRKKITEEKRRNFIIKLSKDKSEHKKQLENINKDYSFMSEFNEYHVTPENKLFAVINSLLAIIEHKIPNVITVKELEFNSSINIEQLKKKLPNIDEKLLLNELNKPVKLSLKAFPKNKEKFITELFPKVIKAIEDNNIDNDLINDIRKNLDFPKIPNNKEEVFLWTNMFTWKCSIDEDSFIYDSYIRSDELWKNHNIDIKNSTLAKWVIHWWNNKIINDSKIYATVIHWEIKIRNSDIWNFKHHSAYHNTEIIESTQTTWWVVANGTKIKNSHIWFGNLLMPWSEIIDSKTWQNTIMWASSIEDCEIPNNSYIWDWFDLEWIRISNEKKPILMFNKRKHRSSNLVKSLY